MSREDWVCMCVCLLLKSYINPIACIICSTCLTWACIYLLYCLLLITHITNRLAHRIPRLSSSIRVARTNSPGPGPVQAASEVPPRQQLLLLSKGASSITCLCSIIIGCSLTSPRDYGTENPDETLVSRSRHTYFVRFWK